MQYLIGEFSAGRNAILIIDEAQKSCTPSVGTDSDAIESRNRSGKLLQIVLIGQPELRQQLARPELRQLNQRIALRYQIQPFNRETVDYINHRLVVAGSHGGAKFSHRALSAIYRLSVGIPRRSTSSAIVPCCQPTCMSNLIEHTHVRQASTS